MSVMVLIIGLSPFNVKLLRRRIAFANTEGREERGDAEIITSHSVPPNLRLLRVLRRRQWRRRCLVTDTPPVRDRHLRSACFPHRVLTGLTGFTESLVGTDTIAYYCHETEIIEI